MHDKAALRPHAVLTEIEPALPANEVANFDQPEHAVIVAGGCRKCREATTACRQSATSAPANPSAASLRHVTVFCGISVIGLGYGHSGS